MPNLPSLALKCFRELLRFKRYSQVGIVGCLLFLLWLGTGCQAQVKDPGVVQITLWHGINPPPNRDVFQDLVDRFNQTHPTVQVEAVYIGQADQQPPKILTAVVGNAAPDILWYNPTITGQLVELGAIQPLENWFNQLPIRSNIDPTLLEAMALDQHLWSVPMATNNLAVFYRPSLFEAAGITALPETWEDFQAVAQRLTRDDNGDGKIDQYGLILPLGKGEWTVFSWLPFLFSTADQLITDDQVNLLNSGAISALGLWSDLVRSGAAMLSAPERGYEQDDFISGKVAMQITGPWTLEYLEQTGIDYGVMAIPTHDQRATVVGGEHLFVMKTSPKQEQAALQFLDYVLSQDFQGRWSLGTGYLPVNLQTRQSQQYRDFVAQQPTLKVFLEQMNWARSRPIIAGYARLSESLGRSIEAALLGESPEVALKTAQDRIDLIFN
ncbi:MAG: ABC transporter substrate-binding protein [Oscillatoriales cyanobacterium RM2_1_1]|nr:ABC transporter substrate-binding protein [Oscillatoriales cyanobacterium SM2_3_0]NJO45479.1 ABC transporter substrate-binding protein [Oscillatoriales cyanobacterium RM2_1_1]